MNTARRRFSKSMYKTHQGIKSAMTSQLASLNQSKRSIKHENPNITCNKSPMRDVRVHSPNINSVTDLKTPKSISAKSVGRRSMSHTTNRVSNSAMIKCAIFAPSAYGYDSLKQYHQSGEESLNTVVVAKTKEG